MEILEIINKYINRYGESVAEIYAISDAEERERALCSFLQDRGRETIYPTILYVAILEVHRCYGGPEEGGWYYDASCPIECVQLDVRWSGSPGLKTWDIDLNQLEMIHQLCTVWDERYSLDSESQRHNVRGGPDYYVDVDFTPQKPEPEEQPRYE